MPLGMRRDGSDYTRIEWASHTESAPTFWGLIQSLITLSATAAPGAQIPWGLRI